MTTSNTADVGGMDGDSVQLEEETHEVVEAKIDQDLTQACLDTRHFLAAWSGLLLGDAASLHDGPEGRYERMESKNATKADLDVGIHGYEEVLDKGKDGEVVTSHTHREV